MYPSGQWDGFWEQPQFGRQPMLAFTLHFRDGTITGGGSDVVGRFSMSGTYDTRTGRVEMIKQYLGKHQVRYTGLPDGEGTILGKWSIMELWSGPFAIRPVLARPKGDEPIGEALANPW